MTRTLFLALAIVLLLVGDAWAPPAPGGAITTAGTAVATCRIGNAEGPTKRLAGVGIPAGRCGRAVNGALASVIDATGKTDCTVGGAATVTICQYDGTLAQWVSAGGGGGGGGGGGTPDNNSVGIDQIKSGIFGDFTCVSGSSCGITASAIIDADVNPTAGINATKLADGSVTSAEFARINTLSSNAQDQINSKLPIADAITTPVGVAYGGTGLVTAPANAVIVGNATTWLGKVIPACTDAATKKLFYNTSTAVFTCETDANTGGGSSSWTDADPMMQSVVTRDVAIGPTHNNTAKLSVDGDADQVQLSIQGNATQTNSLIVAENSAGTDQFTLSNTGAGMFAGAVTAPNVTVNSGGTLTVTGATVTGLTATSVAAGAELSVASAGTTSIGNRTTENFLITGTTNIGSFGLCTPGKRVQGRFDTGSVLTLLHSANLLLPGGANIVTAAGDRFGATCIATTYWDVTWYTRAAATTTGGDMINANAETITGVKTFASNSFLLTGSAGTARINGSVFGVGSLNYWMPQHSGILIGTNDTATVSKGMIYLATAADGTGQPMRWDEVMGPAEVLLSGADSAWTAGKITASDGVLLDMHSVVPNTATEGILLPQSSSCTSAVAQGQVCWDTNSSVLHVGNGSSSTTIAGGTGDMQLAVDQVVTGIKTFGTVGGTVGKLKLAGSTSGTTIINAAAVAGTTTVTTPSVNGALIGSNDTGTLTSAQLASILTNETGTGAAVFGAANPTITLANGTGLPISTGVSGLGAGIATALAVNVGVAGAPAVVVASGTVALHVSAIASGVCETTAATATATGAATTDVVTWTPNADISTVTGYKPEIAGAIIVYPYVTTNTVNFRQCNPTAYSITPGAVTLNWRIVR